MLRAWGDCEGLFSSYLLSSQIIVGRFLNLVSYINWTWVLCPMHVQFWKSISQEKLEKNGKQLQNHISQLVPAISRKDVLLIEENGLGSMLSLRAQNPLFKFNGFPQGSGDKDYANSQEVVSSTSTKLPYVEKIPPYTSWIFLDRWQVLKIFLSAYFVLWMHQLCLTLDASFPFPST